MQHRAGEVEWVSGYLTDAALQAARASVPIVCVDLVPVRSPGPDVEVGLIRRQMADRGKLVWCHLGGRVRRGEPLRTALLRHLHSTLGTVSTALPGNPQPRHVMQWFPTTVLVEPGLRHGYDPRQHAVALVFPVILQGEPAVQVGGEAVDFRWWRFADLVCRDDLWPGTLATVAGALGRPYICPLEHAETVT